MMASLDWSLLAPPLLTGLLVSLTHVPLGQRVLACGIIFMDLAVAQIAGLGIIIAGLLGYGGDETMTQLAAGAFALLGALWLHLCEQHWPDVQEALIGVTFVLAAVTSLLLLAHDPHGGEHIRTLLSGQILWSSVDQLPVPAALSAIVLGLLWGTPARFRTLAFYVAFALAVTASVQLVGVYLVFSTLIIPALAVRHQQGWQAVVSGYVITAIAYGSGLVLSNILDLPAGPLIVWMLVISALLWRTGYRTLQTAGA